MPSSFIRDRAAKAKAASRLVADQRSTAQAKHPPIATRTHEHHATPATPSAAPTSARQNTKTTQPAPKPAPIKPPNPHAATTTRRQPQKPVAAAKKGRTALSSTRGDLNLTPEQVVELFRRHASRPDVLDAIPAEDVAGAFSAVVRGATIAGKEGNGDRSMLWRMLGLPWGAAGGAIGTRAEAAAFGAALGDRLVRAVSRREMHLSGRSPVTLDIDEDGKPAPSLPIGRVGDMMLDHVRYPSASVEGDQPSPAVPAPRPHAATSPGAGRGQEPEAGEWGEEDEATVR